MTPQNQKNATPPALLLPKKNTKPTNFDFFIIFVTQLNKKPKRTNFDFLITNNTKTMLHNIGSSKVYAKRQYTYNNNVNKNEEEDIWLPRKLIKLTIHSKSIYT